MTDNRLDLGRTVFAVLFIVGLLAASLWILLPFIGPMLWAVMIVWPPGRCCYGCRAGCWASARPWRS
jgi:hypothetical protein